MSNFILNIVRAIQLWPVTLCTSVNFLIIVLNNSLVTVDSEISTFWYLHLHQLVGADEVSKEQLVLRPYSDLLLWLGCKLDRWIALFFSCFEVFVTEITWMYHRLSGQVVHGKTKTHVGTYLNSPDLIGEKKLVERLSLFLWLQGVVTS